MSGATASIAVGAVVSVLSGARAGMAVGARVAAGAEVGFGVAVAVEPQAASASNSNAAANVLKIVGCFANFISVYPICPAVADAGISWQFV